VIHRVTKAEVLHSVAYVAMVLVVAVGFFQLQGRTTHQLRENQLKACARGNILRTVLRANEDTLKQFVKDVIKTRTQQGNLYKLQGNKAQAAANYAAATRYAESLKGLTSIQIIDCKKAIR
jgi:hypothetical protein